MTVDIALQKISLEIIECPACGAYFGATITFIAAHRKTGNKFYCPAGHSMSYDSEIDKLKGELVRAAKKLEAEERRTQQERQYREYAEGSLRATRGQVTKLRKRIANGVCPCCHRQFQNVASHMKLKHPDYAVETEEAK